MSNALKVLVVEDERITAKFLETLVTKWGYIPCGVADTGEKAIDIAEKETPDIVLMDVNLSGQIDGIEAAEKIHQRASRAVIIYITAASREKTSIIEDKELLLRKPINPNVLRETIKRVSEKKVQAESISPALAKSKTVLMVEDSKLTAKIQKRILERLGYVILDIVETGEEAVEKAASLKPEVVLSDIDLAGKMNGIEAAHQIYDRFKIPIVYVSGRKDVEREPFVCVNKQAFTADDLQSAIEEAIRRG